MKLDYSILKDFERFMREGDIEKQRPLSDNTVRVYLNTIKRFITFLNERGIEITDHKPATEFLLYLKNEKKYKPSSLLKERMALITFLRFLDIPHVEWKTGSVIIKEPKWFKSPNDILKIMSYCRNLRDKTIIMITYDCALRVSEVHKLNVDDIIDIDGKKYLRLISPKKEIYEYALVPISEPAYELLKEYLEYRKREIEMILAENTDLDLNPEDIKPLFLNGLKRISYREIQHIFRMASKRAGFDITNIHSLRHSRCTHLILSGAKLPIVSKFMRHKNIETTMRYFHWLGRNIEEEISPTISISNRDIF